MHKTNLQWHPAFFAGLQIELADENENLIFENEHLLGTKPTQIDVLVIKKIDSIPIQKNIGQIFRKYNIIEYKSPSDYLSIDDFYKVYAYACFYKSLSAQENAIHISDLTITFVCKNIPRKFIKHLKQIRFYKILKVFSGIYYIKGDIMPIQLIVTSQLEIQENLWLYSLTDELSNQNEVLQIIGEYQKHQNQKLYDSVMDIVIRANREKFREGDTMCKALDEIIDEIMESRLSEREQIGMTQGISQGILKGEEYYALLTQKLFSDSRIKDLQKAAFDYDYRHKLYSEYGICMEETPS